MYHGNPHQRNRRQLPVFIRDSNSVNYNVNVVGKEREQPSMFSQLLVAAIPIMLYLMCMIGGSYYLARRKTNHPIFAAIIGGGFALIPPLGLIYLAFLVFKKDVA